MAPFSMLAVARGIIPSTWRARGNHLTVIPYGNRLARHKVDIALARNIKAVPCTAGIGALGFYKPLSANGADQ